MLKELLDKKYYFLVVMLLITFLIASFSFPSRQSKSNAEPTGSWGSYADTEWAGSGTQSSPYLISTPEELAGLAQQANSYNYYDGIYFRQTSDLDMSAHKWSSYQQFRGNYDGDCYAIIALTSALFDDISNASITNIRIVNAQVDAVFGDYGVLAKSAISSTIKNCYVEADVNYICPSGPGFVSIDGFAGVIGRADDSTIEQCVFDGQVNAQVYNNGGVGGIVGLAYNCRIVNCYNLGNIFASFTRYCDNGNVGGIAGYNESGNLDVIANCFNVGTVTGASYSVDYLNIGGIIGWRRHSIYNCFNTAAVSYETTSTSSTEIYRGGITGRDMVNATSTYSCYYGGDCTLNYGTGGIYSGSGSNSGQTKISNLNSTTYAKRRGWYTILSNWNYAYLWDFAETWELVTSYNDGYPYICDLFEFNVISHTNRTYRIGEVINISNPTRDGYIFTGWTGQNVSLLAQHGATSTSLEKWEDPSVAVNSSYFMDLAAVGHTATLNSVWKEIQYNVQLNYNDGVTSNRTISNIPYLTVFNVPNPTRTAYNFAGWSSSNKDDTALVGDSATSCTTSWTSGTTKATFFSKLTSTDGRTVILTANWDPINYTIDFDLNGGTLSNPFSSYNTESTTTLPEPSKTGYTFTGWYCTASNGNWKVGTTYPAGTALTGMYGNVSFRATWRANTYTLTFDPQGGSVDPTSIQVTYGQTYGYHNGGVLPTPTLIDNNFSGWCTQFGDMELYERGALDIYTIAGDSTLYAYWTDTWNMYTEKPGGNGTTASPYLISEPEHLGWLSYEVARGRETTAVCKQTANIDLIQSRGYLPHIPYWYSIGTPNYPFRGSYDGNGFKIEILQVLDEYKNNVGIFGYTNGARIDKIYVSNTSYLVHGNQVNLSTYRNTNIAGIIAYAQGSTILSNSAFYGQLATTENMTNTGALIGYAANTVTIRDCVIFYLNNTYGDGSSVGVSGGNPRIESCVYKINGVKGYTFTGYSDTTETNYVIVDYLSVPVPAGLSWLAYGGERATLAEIKAWANS